jgi:serine/threonine-protein kinase
MAVKIAGRYRGRVIARRRRRLVLGTALSLATIGPLASGLGGGPSLARADGIMLVEAGAFWMGRDSGAPDEAPRHRVYVRDFWLERDKVTNRELAEFLDARGLRSPEGARYVDPDDPDVRIHRRDGRLIADAGFEAHPAVAVSWFGARDYCLWRGRRLPTEAEWEKAARGTDGRCYPWGDRFDPTFCHMRESRPYPQQPEPVGTFPTDESPYGVRDMAGCIREWVGDVFGEQSSEQLLVEPEPPPGTPRGDSSLRRVRGGGWQVDGKWARAASRGAGFFALTRGTGTGFRCAKTLVKGER